MKGHEHIFFLFHSDSTSHVLCLVTPCLLQIYDACSFDPCHNGATCMTSPPSHVYTCDCLDGYTGDTCETNIDDCVNHNCPSYQVCVDGIGQYTCECPLGEWNIILKVSDINKRCTCREWWLPQQIVSSEMWFIDALRQINIRVEPALKTSHLNLQNCIERSLGLVYYMIAWDRFSYNLLTFMLQSQVCR